MSRPMMTNRTEPRRLPAAGECPLTRPVTRLWHSLLAATILFASALPAVAQSQVPSPAPAQFPAQFPAQPEIERIEDWSLQCTATPAIQPKSCFLIHDVFQIQGDQRILQIVVGRFGASNVLVARFYVPLGIRLPPGLTLQVDRNTPQQMPLERCTTRGCQAQIFLDDALLAAFKAGNGGNLIFDDAAGQSIVVAFSLKGFTSGIEKLP